MEERRAPVRVAFVVTEDWWLRLHWLALARAARDAGYEVTLITRLEQHAEELRAECFAQIIDMDFGRGRLSPWVNLRAAWRLRALYRQLRPHLIHHFALQPIVLGSFAAAFAMSPSRRPAMVNTLAGLGWTLSSGGSLVARAIRRLLPWMLGRALRRSRVHVQNPDDAAFVASLGVAAERIAMVPGAGVNVHRFTPRPEPRTGPLRVTMVARLLWDKGVAEFVEAAAMVRARRGDIVFTLVGAPDEGNPAAVPVERLKAWHDAGDIEWWGARDDIPRVWADSHIAALPSYYREGLPNALTEAAACGRAAITTDMPGCREAVRHDGNGLLVPPRDARALADAVLELADDPTRRAAMGAAGRRRAETEFADERVHEATLRIYAQALSDRPPK